MTTVCPFLSFLIRLKWRRLAGALPAAGAEAKAWAAAHNIPPAASDRRRLCLLLIDVQNTFCIPGFELFVGGRSGRGAVDDNRRLVSLSTATWADHQHHRHPRHPPDHAGVSPLLLGRCRRQQPTAHDVIHYDDVVQASGGSAQRLRPTSPPLETCRSTPCTTPKP
jgi:hypothetical protein